MTRLEELINDIFKAIDEKLKENFIMDYTAEALSLERNGDIKGLEALLKEIEGLNL